MIEVKFYDKVADDLLKFAVIISKAEDRKHRKEVFVLKESLLRLWLKMILLLKVNQIVNNGGQIVSHFKF